MTENLKDLYQSSERFRGYVDRCAANYGVSGQKILSLALTREVAKSYKEADAEEAGRIPAVNSTYAPMGECV